MLINKKDTKTKRIEIIESKMRERERERLVFLDSQFRSHSFDIFAELEGILSFLSIPSACNES